MDKKLLQEFVKAIKAITPEGACFSVEGIPVNYVVELTCNGWDRDMGYHCCLKPGHDGECFSIQKGVFFRDNNAL